MVQNQVITHDRLEWITSVINKFFYHGVCFTGELTEEEEVLQWLITQRTEDRIELITRVMLEEMVEGTQYLAVYFCKFVFTEKENECIPFNLV